MNIKKINEALENIKHSLGEATGKDSSVVVFGREYKTKVFNSVDDTNDFLEKNPDYGVIADLDNKIHVAKLSDKGKEIKSKIDKVKK